MTILTAIGLMSDDALDGVRLAVLETDGEGEVRPGPAHFYPYSRDLKIFIRRAMKAAAEGRVGAADIGKAAGEVTEAHAIAVDELLEKAGLKRASIDVIGFHGQTILHRPRRQADMIGRSWQIGDGARLAEDAKIDVVCDFRSADIFEGGEGGPLSPIYHAALVRALDPDGAVGVIDFDDAATVTYVPHGGGDLDIVAYDSGPGFLLLDQWMELKTGEREDRGGAAARAGAAHDDIIRMMLLNPYLRRKPTKFLDRGDFKLDPVSSLSLFDGAATLTALSAACVNSSAAHLPDAPNDWIVIGRGRRNPAVMEALGATLDGAVHDAESLGWRCDALEAECAAYLAVRSLRKLPLTFPRTTRAPRPIIGGTYHRAPA